MSWNFHDPKEEMYGGINQWTIVVDVPAGFAPAGQAATFANKVVTLYYKIDTNADADTDTWYTSIEVRGDSEPHELFADLDPADPRTADARRRKPVTMATSGGGGDDGGNDWKVRAKLDKDRLVSVKYNNVFGIRIPIFGPLFHQIKRWKRNGF